MLRKLEDPKDQETYMHEQLLVDHFKKILSDPGAKRRMEEVQSTEMNGSLDYKITKEEKANFFSKRILFNTKVLS